MSRGSDARVRELMMIAKQVKTSNPFCFSSILRFSNKPKMALFGFYGQDPSKMGVLAPSRKPLRIGLYREGRKGPKSAFFGWSGFWPKWPFFGFFGVFMKMMIFYKISTHFQSQRWENFVENGDDENWQNFVKTMGLYKGLVKKKKFIKYFSWFLDVMNYKNWKKIGKKQGFEKNTIFAIFKIWIFFWLF